MPDVRLDPVNQCFVDRPDLEDPADNPALQGPPPAPSPLTTSDGAGGAGGAGSDVLVRRFTEDGGGGTEGAGGAPGAPAAAARSVAARSCVVEDLRVLASCGGLAKAVRDRDPVNGLLGTLNCSLALIALAECAIDPESR